MRGLHFSISHPAALSAGQTEAGRWAGAELGLSKSGTTLCTGHEGNTAGT